MKPVLYMMCGLPGSGKTTWAKNYMKRNVGETIRYISRDEIRFHLLKENEDYFSHEKEVFTNFSKIIAHALDDGFDVIADATHLNKKSRQKLIRALTNYSIDFDIICVCPQASFVTCMERNNLRKGRAFVPPINMISMQKNFETPSIEEDSHIIEIWSIRSKI